MLDRRFIAIVLAGALVLSSCSGSGAAVTADVDTVAPGAADGQAGIVAVVNVNVFDGTKMLPSATVIVEDGLITEVGDSVDVPAAAQVVAGTGMTLLPGFIDSHTHTFFGPNLARAVQFGVTTHLDMFTSPALIASEQAADLSGPPRPQTDLFSAGILGTSKGGHGTQFGVPVPTLDTPEDVPGWVQDRVDEGASYIKLVLEGGSTFGRTLPTLSDETLTAAIGEAAGRDLLVITHVSTREEGTLAIESGSNGLAHMFVDATARDPFVELMVDREAFVVPTLVVLSSISDTASGQSVIDDSDLGPRLDSQEKDNLKLTFPGRPIRLQTAIDSVTNLHAAGVPILAGSDAPNPGTIFGASLHRELEYFVEAGMTPAEALASATSVPADVFGLTDRGRIAPGMIADLVLVNGDPTVDITATRSIAAVWKDGIAIPIDR